MAGIAAVAFVGLGLLILGGPIVEYEKRAKRLDRDVLLQIEADPGFSLRYPGARLVSERRRRLCEDDGTAAGSELPRTTRTYRLGLTAIDVPDAEVLRFYRQGLTDARWGELLGEIPNRFERGVAGHNVRLTVSVDPPGSIPRHVVLHAETRCTTDD